MALTLAEGEKYSTTHLSKVVIDRLTKGSDILKVLPFEPILGNSLTYDTITTDSTAAFYSVGDTWAESTPSLTQTTAALVILGKDADVDNFILSTRSDQLDVKGTVLDNAVKAVQYKYLDTFFYGSTSTDAKSFNGLHGLMTSTTYNTVHAGSSTGTALSINKLRQAIDLVKNGRPTMIAMSKQLRRYISIYLDSVGSAFPREPGKFGGFVETFDGIPISVDEHILDTETAASGAYSASTGGGNTTIFILKFGPQYTCGISSGAVGNRKTGVVVEPLGNLETKDAQRWRIKWYCSLMFQDLRSCAKVDGVDADGTVTA